MQTIQKNEERIDDRRDNGKARRIKMPERRTLIVAGAIAGGSVAAGLVMFYYLRRRMAERTP